MKRSRMISLVNEFSAVLDTYVLLPISLCDLLLKLAQEPAIYTPKWSNSIIEELQRNLQGPKFGLSEQKASYRVACIKSAFPEAMVDGCEAISASIPNDEKDRHVLTAAVVGRADAIITVNVRDFPPECLQNFGIERLHPDEFLCHQLSVDQGLVMERFAQSVLGFKVHMRKHLQLLRRMIPDFSMSLAEHAFQGQLIRR